MITDVVFGIILDRLERRANDKAWCVHSHARAPRRFSGHFIVTATIVASQEPTRVGVLEVGQKASGFSFGGVCRIRNCAHDFGNTGQATMIVK